MKVMDLQKHRSNTISLNVVANVNATEKTIEQNNQNAKTFNPIHDRHMRIIHFGGFLIAMLNVLGKTKQVKKPLSLV